MQDTYTHLPQSALNFQHSANGDHGQMQNSPQCDSFENSNREDYISSYANTVPQWKTTTNREQGSYLAKGFHREQELDDQYDHEVPNIQFEPSALGAFAQFVRVSRVNPSSVNFGFLTKSPFSAEWLEELLNEFKEFSAYAQDEDIEEPSEVALSKAKNLLKEISFYVFDRPDVYPMQERCIAIDFRGPESKSGVLFVIEQDGSGALYRRTENSRGRLRVDDAADLLSEGGIMELKRVGIR